MSLGDSSEEQRSRLYERVKHSIVYFQNEGEVVGGGVFVQVGSRQFVLTAAHVLYDRNGLKLECYDQRSFDFDVVKMSRSKDLAVVSIIGGNGDEFPCLKLSDGEIDVGMEIHFIGHPDGKCFAYNIGRICCVSKTCGDIYRNELFLANDPRFNTKPDPRFIDDFLGLSSSLRFVQAKNVHGGGRVGGTGTPFLNGNGDIVGVYSFTYKDSDYGVHLDEIKEELS
ncbi:hypothetical protein DM860_009618 [Cuscuta australis]|uniref:Peptidase S1 domain-containing protein n=1 Tax=Cuscuta australis TaxID=267555 RepID=A0A328DJS0_9ASTE|nr:hypothetical protein DM860_009618 [Cuscuta australis]